MSRRSAAEDGFTLVELLVSLALLALMVAYAFSALSMLRDLNRIADRSEAQAEVDAAARHMREAIADARVMFKTDQEGVQILMFDGKPDSIEFIGSSNGERETGGLYRIRFFMNDQHELIAERTLQQMTSVGPVNRIILVSPVNSLRFSYRSSREDSYESWSGSWPSGNTLPSAVEIAVENVNGDMWDWPRTIVRVRATQ
jgi:prepilin-type N-terminal cleavage/methylation domain-containing protein